MPDDLRMPIGVTLDTASVTRHDRPAGLAFLADPQSEAALRDGLADLLPGLEIRRGGIRGAIAAQQKSVNPRVLVVDVGGEDHPLAALGELSMVVEPDTCVLVVGEVDDLALYREITRGLGAAEYLPKPLTRDGVLRHFGPLVRGQSPETDRVSGGRLVTVTGARGGVGCSVLAASLAWHFGTEANRHTVLLDTDLHRGTAALLLDTEPGEGLRTALEAPERIDALLAERAAQPIAERLHVLSALEPLGRTIDYVPGAADHLLEALRRRYNVVLADVPCQPGAFCRDLLSAAHHRIVVMTPTLPAVRDALRLLALGDRSGARPPTTLVLNRLGMPGGLKRSQVEEALRVPLDVVIPDLPRQVSAAVTLGEPAAASAFRNGVAAIARHIGVLRQPGLPETGAAPRKGWRFRLRR
jgi:pilus assembly protein CpaE